MWGPGVVIPSIATSAEPSPCGLGPATSSATAGLAAPAALAEGRPVSGKTWPAELIARSDGLALGLPAATVPPGWASLGTCRPAGTARAPPCPAGQPARR